MKPTIVLLALLSFGGLADWWHRLTAEPVATAANHRGVEAYGKKDYSKAEEAFAKEAKLHPTPTAAFNVGTTKIAAGKREEGSAALAEAMKDPALRAAALYNRGNSALSAGSFDHAIHDYTEALRLRPNDRNAKRNLEIALIRNRQKQEGDAKSGAGPSQPSSGGQQPKAPPQPSRAQGGPRQETDADALLRSVQQQEQEELSRMRKTRDAPKKVGW
jgi:Ca-activated chloride channel family protein